MSGSAPRSMLRLRLLALAILIATFVAGGLTGVAYERTAATGPSSDIPPPPRTGGGRRDPPPDIFVAGGPLAELLDLSPEQSRRIESIMAADRAKARAAFDEIEPRLRARFDSTRTAIEAVLTEEQREEFQRMQQQRRARLRERFGEEGRARPGPGRGGERGRPPR